jgi:hypothetical protein
MICYERDGLTMASARVGDILSDCHLSGYVKVTAKLDDGRVETWPCRADGHTIGRPFIYHPSAPMRCTSLAQIRAAVRRKNK